MKVAGEGTYDAFHKTRLALFVRSYSGLLIANHVRDSVINASLVKKLAKVLLFNQKLLYCFINHKTCVSKFSKISTQDGKTREKLVVYLKIEKELILLAEEKLDKNGSVFQDYEYALLAPAIERIAGNSIADIKNDSELEDKLADRKNLYNRWYYETASRYRLPTIRIVPFLLRLID